MHPRRGIQRNAVMPRTCGQPGTLIVLGHFPPPVHGMAIAVERFALMLEDAAHDHRVRLVRLDITADHTDRGIAYHTHRLSKVFQAVFALLTYRRTACVYMSVDAGYGMLYTLLVALAARFLATPLYLHHHAADYLRNSSWRFRALCEAGSTVTCHLVGCETMAASLRSNYPSARQVDVLPILYAVGSHPSNTARRSRLQGDSVVLGHLSNLSIAKGLETIFDTADAVRAAGADCELLIAGPAFSDADQAVLEQRLRMAGDRARHLGPVSGQSREEFFDAIDLFLFPSRYLHESFGLVVGEALCRGVPVITYANVCMDRGFVGDAGLVLALEEPYAERAATWINAVRNDQARSARVVNAASTFAQTRHEAVADAVGLARKIAIRAGTCGHC